MGFSTGIKRITAATANSNNDVQHLRITDGQSLRIRIISELDESSPFFDPKRGLAGLHMQHELPSNWRHKIQCTMEDEGQCRGCELYGQNKKYRAKGRFYVNVLVDDGLKDKFVAVWDLAQYKTPPYDAIMSRFYDTGSISNLEWKLKRTGAGQQDTTYTFQPVSFDRDDEPYVWPENLKVYDLAKVVEYVPYKDQEALYGASTISAEPSESMAWV